jgi:hypothetical protein
MIVVKLSGARERKRAKSGRCEGRKLFGTRDGEAAIVERMVHLRREGKTLDQIADRLNADGVPTRVKDGRWYNTTVRRILQVAGADKPRRGRKPSVAAGA